MSTHLEFGLLDHTELRPGVALDQLFRERLELVQAAEQAGFVRFHTTEHHLSRLDATPSPGLLLAAATQRTSIIRLASLVHIVTLPTELDASFKRALPMLEKERILKPVDLPHARRLLKAAALTYLSASLASLLNIARWWAILRR